MNSNRIIGWVTAAVTMVSIAIIVADMLHDWPMR